MLDAGSVMIASLTGCYSLDFIWNSCYAGTLTHCLNGWLRILCCYVFTCILFYVTDRVQVFAQCICTGDVSKAAQNNPKKSLQPLLQRFADFALKYIFKTLFPPQSYACTTIFVDEEFSVSRSGLSECHNSLLKYEAEAHVLYTVHHVRKALNLHSVWWPAGVDCLRSDCRSESASRDYNRTCM